MIIRCVYGNLQAWIAKPQRGRGQSAGGHASCHQSDYDIELANRRVGLQLVAGADGWRGDLWNWAVYRET